MLMTTKDDEYTALRSATLQNAISIRTAASAPSSARRRTGRSAEAESYGQLRLEHLHPRDRLVEETFSHLPVRPGTQPTVEAVLQRAIRRTRPL